jgi:hypothetical protein
MITLTRFACSPSLLPFFKSLTRMHPPAGGWGNSVSLIRQGSDEATGRVLASLSTPSIVCLRDSAQIIVL